MRPKHPWMHHFSQENNGCPVGFLLMNHQEVAVSVVARNLGLILKTSRISVIALNWIVCDTVCKQTGRSYM